MAKSPLADTGGAVTGFSSAEAAGGGSVPWTERNGGRSPNPQGDWLP